MNANLLYLLLAILVTASITDIHAYRKGHFDRRKFNRTNVVFTSIITTKLAIQNNVKCVLFQRLVSDEIHNKISVCNNFESQLHLHCNHLHNPLSVIDLAVDESDTNAEIDEFHNNDPRDTMDIYSEYDIEQLCSLTKSLGQYYAGNCMRNSSQSFDNHPNEDEVIENLVNEDDVNSAFGQMSFDNHPDENENIENHDNVPGDTVDISSDALANSITSFDQ
ncbi:unnamed protein product [Schistosoma margrebowiei]|uniref:Uncharacterized protein n=1 Tax=Schistosoma margrebowiei TaxID=48269 RepID=A0AA85AGY3_9TREM|nr:unnamed protein product [Schistosoma margrebowiei]